MANFANIEYSIHDPVATVAENKHIRKKIPMTRSNLHHPSKHHDSQTHFKPFYSNTVHFEPFISNNNKAANRKDTAKGNVQQHHHSMEHIGTAHPHSSHDPTSDNSLKQLNNQQDNTNHNNYNNNIGPNNNKKKQQQLPPNAGSPPRVIIHAQRPKSAAAAATATTTSPSSPSSAIRPSSSSSAHQDQVAILHAYGLPPTAHHRFNPREKLAQHDPGPTMSFSAKPVDRDLLILEQDLSLSKYRIKHPELYPPITALQAIAASEQHHLQPALTKEICHHDPRKKVLSRDRSLPRTNGTVLNDSLPFHPYLVERLDHGIHQERWSTMTVIEDDPVRYKPVISASIANKSHDSFMKYYHTKDRNEKIASVPSNRTPMMLVMKEGAV